MTAICTKRLLITLHGQSLNRGLPWPFFCHEHLDPVLYARLNLFILKQCSLPLRCFWFTLVQCCFFAVQLLKSLRWRRRRKSKGEGRGFSTLLYDGLAIDCGWEYMAPDKQTVKCFDADETGSCSLNTRISRDTVCSSLCCFGRAKQMESVNNEYVISFNLRCWINLSCFPIVRILIVM